MGLFQKKDETTNAVELMPVAKETMTVSRARSADANASEFDETCYVAKQTVLTGDMESQGSVDFLGTITGSLTCKKSLLITGTVEGNVSAANVTIQGGMVHGNISCTGHVVLSEGARLVGNITAKEVEISGTVVGNIQAEGRVKLAKDALVKGDVATGYLEILQGAGLTGAVTAAGAFASQKPEEYLLENAQEAPQPVAAQ